MRISDALALGRTMLKPIAGHHITPDGTHGCAWGMIQVAAPSEYGEMIRRGPSMKTPCGCKMGYTGGMAWGPIHDNFVSVVVHLFNQHVMTEKNWTLDQLIDWVRTVEPEPVAEPEPAPTLPVEPEPETEPEEECEIQEHPGARS